MKQSNTSKQTKQDRQIRYIAKREGINIGLLKRNLAKGLAVILANKNHKGVKPVAVGKDLTVKVNANIGASPASLDGRAELKKTQVSIEAGADTVMDLTIVNKSKDIDRIRRAIIENCPQPLGTVPIYQAAIETGGVKEMTIEGYLKVYERQAKEGVDFTTVHAGITRASLRLVKRRLMPVVSRGGSFLLNWMLKNNKENFLYEHFDEILDIAKEYNMTISLGDGLRPGCIADSTDRAQLYELRILGELQQRARDKGVQVIIEGPGHIPLNEIQRNVELEKEICHGAPFYVLGPLPIDTAAGYDHIACSIGGALAGYYGADFLCYVTPKEHIGLPDVEDVRLGVVVTKIAASIADVARGNKKAINQSRLMSSARRDFNWLKMSKYAIDSKEFDKLIKKIPRLKKGGCSMCGDEFCALRVYKIKKKGKR
ncbi:MAG TPA: phosphomethylpyrimidine synthase ThiC [Candidatus Omnitrophica bacterium]|nr:phosphomethylpyrimidine synthase ThiC [Candidatus Omnitrophota bacterium]